MPHLGFLTNLLHGVVEEVGPDRALVRLDTGDRCPIDAVGREAGQAVDISLRPEAVAIRASEGDVSAPDIDAVVEQVAYLGNAVQYLIRTRGGLGMTVLSAKTGPRLIAEQGVALSWSPAEALVLGDRPASMEE